MFYQQYHTSVIWLVVYYDWLNRKPSKSKTNLPTMLSSNYQTIMLILGILYLQVAIAPLNMGSKPTCSEEQSEGIAVESQMS